MDEMEARTETVMPGQEGKVVQLGVNSLRASNRRALAKTKEDLAELDQREANILGIYGEDIKKEALNDAKKEQKQEQQTQNPPYTPPKTDKKTKTEDVLKPQKDWKTREQALNRIAYAKGEKDFEEYTNRMTEIDMEYNQRLWLMAKLRVNRSWRRKHHTMRRRRSSLMTRTRNRRSRRTTTIMNWLLRRNSGTLMVRWTKNV